MRLTSVPTTPRSRTTGVICSDIAPSAAIVGFSSRRNSGNVSKFFSRFARSSAVAWAAMFACTIAWETFLRFFAHSASTRSPDRAPSASRRFWLARIFSTLSSSRRAGFAPRITLRRSLPRPASPAPNSFRMIAKRSR